MTEDGSQAVAGDRAAGPADDGATSRPTARPRWPVFLGLAGSVVVADQIAKFLVTSNLAAGQSVDVIGDLVRIVFGQNNGALFGLFKGNAVMFGLVSIAVVGLIVVYHARSAASPYLTVTLGLLLGGAIGNMLDRLVRGYVVDFVDAGIGTTRFYTFNVADSAISLAILLLFVAALRPALVDGSHGGPRSGSSARPGAPVSDDDDPWDDEPDSPAEGPR